MTSDPAGYRSSGYVRGTSKWQHAKVDKVAINLDHDGDKHIYCAWDDCEKDGYESNRVVVNDAAPGHPAKLIKYVFCTDRHKQYWLHSTISCNNLPAGYRNSIV